MKKKMKLIGILGCVILLAGCGNASVSDSSGPSRMQPAETIDSNAGEQSAEEHSTETQSVETQSAEISEDNDEENAASDEVSFDVPSILPPTDEDIETAKNAALSYYEGTVFEVLDIEYMGEELPYIDEEVMWVMQLNFSVQAAKGGEVQEPNRTITLQYIDNAWKVVNEGY